jgi:hypothetical protein
MQSIKLSLSLSPLSLSLSLSPSFYFKGAGVRCLLPVVLKAHSYHYLRDEAHGTECLLENVFEIRVDPTSIFTKKIQSALLGRRRAPKMLARQCTQVSEFCENGGGWR